MLDIKMAEANPHCAELAEKMRTILTLPTSNVKGLEAERLKGF